MKRFAMAVLAIFFATAASAQMKGMDMKDMDHKGMDMKMDKKDAKKKAAGQSHHASGVVKSVDASKGSVMIDHGPVASLNWPAMSMGFKAKDKKALEALKPGQKIDFDFVQQGRDYVITKVK
jgi:Cu(I)/Ag(I) efflux system periplasmic protein CusF